MKGKFFKFLVLSGSLVLTILLRIVSVIEYEPIIHEYDSHFNWRCAQYIDAHGVGAFMGWFDNTTWYPFGRAVGETSYPGMMIISVFVKKVLALFRIQIDLLYVCVYIGTAASLLTTIVSYLFGRVLHNETTGYLCACFAASSVGLINSTSAGRYDYECVATTLMLLCLYFFVVSLEHDSNAFAIASALMYGLLAVTWGGYIFVANLIPVFTIVLLFMGSFSAKLYVSYSLWFVFGTIIAASLPHIHNKVLVRPEHWLGILCFILLQLYVLGKSLSSKQKKWLVGSVLTVIVAVLAPKLSGRLLLIANPFAASKEQSVASTVMEQIPASWALFYHECGPILYLFPIGLSKIIKLPGMCKYMIVIYSVSCLFFSAMMMRLVVIFIPALIFVVSVAIEDLMQRVRCVSFDSFLTLATIIGVLFMGNCHSVSCAFNDTDTHIVFEVEEANGTAEADDFREAYSWLRSNTQADAKIMASWDKGYQILSMAQRSVLADGNTHNFTQIDLITLATGSSERTAWEIARMFDVDYYLTVVGAASGYRDDDIAGFEIAMSQSAQHRFGNISWNDFANNESVFVVGEKMAPAFTESLIFKASYNHFEKFRLSEKVPRGMDLARKVRVGNLRHINLELFEESYTTRHWMVRIYKLKSPL